MQKENNNFINLLKATRIKRALIPLSFIILMTGFANKINTEIIILMTCSVLMYSIGGIVNAKVDKDYRIKYIKTTIAILFLITIILSLYNYIIFVTVLLGFILGYIYSKYSRKILFGDSIILSITHSTLPIISSSILLEINPKLTMITTIFMFLTMTLIIPIKNLKGIEEDKKRGYITFMTKFSNGKQITLLLMQIYFISLFLAYFLFDLSSKFIFILMGIFILKILIDYFLNTKKDVTAYKLIRLVPILFIFGIIFDKAENSLALSLIFSIILIYTISLFFKE